MPTQDTLERFIALVESNAHVDAVEQFYTELSTMQENQGTPRVGRTEHVESEHRMMARAAAIESRCVRPVLVNGDHVVIRWIFRFTWHDGSFMRVEELAWQRWEGERIAEETFFYDPAQRTPRRES